MIDRNVQTAINHINTTLRFAQQQATTFNGVTPEERALHRWYMKKLEGLKSYLEESDES